MRRVLFLGCRAKSGRPWLLPAQFSSRRVPGNTSATPSWITPPFCFLSRSLARKGNKIEPPVVIAHRDTRGWLGRARTGREKTVRRMRAAASRCCFQPGPLAFAQPRRRGGRRPGGHASCLSIFRRLPRRRCARLAAPNRAQLLLYLAAEKTPRRGTDRHH